MSPWPLGSCHVINATSLTRRKKIMIKLLERLDSFRIIKNVIVGASAENSALARILHPVVFPVPDTLATILKRQ